MQDFLVDTFGSTGATIIRVAIAAVVVVGLLMLLRWFLQTYGARLGLGGFGGHRANRLTVVDAVAVDARRRLVLVKRDNVEHLILVGGATDIVVEPTIIRGIPVGSLNRAAPRTQAPEAPPAEAARAPAPAQPGRIVETAVAAAVIAEPPMIAPEPVPEPAPVETAAIVPIAPPPVRLERTNARAQTGNGNGNGNGARTKAAPARPPVRQAPKPVAQAEETPYVPPEPERIEPVPEPIASIVDEPPAPTETTFEDLARQLDEALQKEIAQTETHAAPPVPHAPLEPLAYARPSRGPAAVPEGKAPSAEAPAPAPVRPAPEPQVEAPVAVPPAPVVEAPVAEAKPEPLKPAMPAASAWLRPRKPVEPAPAPAPAPAPVAPPVAKAPVQPERRPAPAPAPVPAPAPAISEPDLEASLAEALAASFGDVAPVAAPGPAVQAEPAPAPAPALPTRAEPPVAERKPATDFGSLEDEMARLLDELAGDSKGKR